MENKFNTLVITHECSREEYSQIEDGMLWDLYMATGIEPLFDLMVAGYENNHLRSEYHFAETYDLSTLVNSTALKGIDFVTKLREKAYGTPSRSYRGVNYPYKKQDSGTLIFELCDHNQKTPGCKVINSVVFGNFGEEGEKMEQFIDDLVASNFVVVFGYPLAMYTKPGDPSQRTEGWSGALTVFHKDATELKEGVEEFLEMYPEHTDKFLYTETIFTR